MNVKRKKSGSVSRADRDQPPEITGKWVAEADLHLGKKLVRRGRPKLEHPRQLISLRLQPEVIANWKATGPGWQTRMAEVLALTTPK